MMRLIISDQVFLTDQIMLGPVIQCYLTVYVGGIEWNNLHIFIMFYVVSDEVLQRIWLQLFLRWILNVYSL